MFVRFKVRSIRASKLFQALEVGEAHGGGKLIHFAVSADRNHVVVAGEAEVLH